MTTRNLPIRERIELHITSKKDCWITDYRVNTKNQQLITIDGKNFRLTRIAYEVYREKVPKNLSVYHTCNNPYCINPDHLFLGTKAENARNTKRKNRQAKGSTISNSKLTEVQVVRIKNLLLEGELTFAEIGKIFCVCAGTIQGINNGRVWTHIEVT
jgi:hypothetical protein